MSVTPREKRAAEEQAEGADRWEPYWTADNRGGVNGEANPMAVEELQIVVKRLCRRVTDLEEEVAEIRRRKADA